jgi:hypothetical protein
MTFIAFPTDDASTPTADSYILLNNIHETGNQEIFLLVSLISGLPTQSAPGRLGEVNSTV